MQDEYLSCGDMSRGHPRTIYNRSWNLIGNLIFHTHWYKPWFYNQWSNLESWRCVTRPVLENLPPVQTPFLQFRVSNRPHRKHFSFMQDRCSVHGQVSKGALPEKMKSFPRPCWILWIFTDIDRSHCFATQGEYWSHGDVSWGHPRTIYNRSWNLIGTCSFSHTLIETMILQSRVQALSHDSVAPDQFWKICHRSKDPSCNLAFPHNRLGLLFFHPGLLFDPWPGVKGAISEKLRTVPRRCWILLICLAHARNLTSPSWAQGLGETICPHTHFWKNDRRFRGPLDTYWFFIGVAGATLFQFGCLRMSITEIISEIENPWSRKGHTTNHWNISNSPNLPRPDHWNTCNLAKKSLKYLQFA